MFPRSDADVTGLPALEAYLALAARRVEVPVNCEATGGLTWHIRFGLSAGTAYVFADDFSGDVADGGECGCRWVCGPAADAARLFGCWVAWLEGRQAMVNSDPMSPDYFNTDVHDLPAAIRNRLGVAVEG